MPCLSARAATDRCLCWHAGLAASCWLPRNALCKLTAILESLKGQGRASGHGSGSCEIIYLPHDSSWCCACWERCWRLQHYAGWE